MLFFFSFYLVARIQQTLRTYAPTNIAIDAMRRGSDRIWMPLAAFAAALGYLHAMGICALIVERGGPGWINLLVLLFLWDALKLTGASVRGLLMSGHALAPSGQSDAGAVTWVHPGVAKHRTRRESERDLGY